MGVSGSPQLTQKLPSSFWFGSRIALISPASFSRKGQKKFLVTFVTEMFPSKPLADQDTSRAEGSAPEDRCRALGFNSSFLPRFRSLLVRSFLGASSPAVLPGQVCAKLLQDQIYMAGFQLSSADCDLNFCLPLTTPPDTISIFTSDNSFIALGEQTRD